MLSERSESLKKSVWPQISRERVHATNLRKHCATIAVYYEVSYDIIVGLFYFKLLSTYKTAPLMKKTIVRNYFWKLIEISFLKKKS